MLRKIGDMRVRDIFEILVNKDGIEALVPYRISKLFLDGSAILKVADKKLKDGVKRKIKKSINFLKKCKKSGRYEKFRYSDS